MFKNEEKISGAGSVSEERYIEYFIIYQFFPKMCNFLRKRQNTLSGAQVSFEGKEASGDENEYKLFYGK